MLMLDYHSMIYSDKIYYSIDLIGLKYAFDFTSFLNGIILSQSWINPNVQNLATELKCLDTYFESRIYL